LCGWETAGFSRRTQLHEVSQLFSRLSSLISFFLSFYLFFVFIYFNTCFVSFSLIFLRNAALYSRFLRGRNRVPISSRTSVLLSKHFAISHAASFHISFQFYRSTTYNLYHIQNISTPSNFLIFLLRSHLSVYPTFLLHPFIRLSFGF
jgi:hypothetical protein